MIRATLVVLGCLASFDGPATPAPEPSYDQMKAAAGRDAASQVKLALWCESHGLEAQKLRHLAVAVLSDPSNAMARGLMGLVEYGGKWRRPEAVADALKADVKHADLMAEYGGRRVRTPVKPDAQYKLALWCEEKGLRDEARAHLATVVRLDPSHADAWKRLGYRKVGKRWVT
ncbi:MAG TPA: tetratricopeptide repeat protein, partial [Isosphaeraceae bacterium]